jgi:hypothetical protein
MLQQIESVSRREIDRQDWADETRVTFISPILSRLYDYWDDRRAGDAMPARADIDPIQFHYALGFILLIDVLPGHTRFRIRLHGTDLAWRAGCDLTGRIVDELPPGDLRLLAQKTFHDVIQTCRPRRAERKRVLDSRLRHYEALVLPLGADRSEVDMLLVGFIHHQGKG